MLILPNQILWRAYRRHVLRNCCSIFVLFCATWLVTPGRSAETISASKRTVLVLYGEPLSVPANRMTEQCLTAGLSREHPGDLEIFSEYLDFTRFPRAQYEDDLVRYLRARYTTRKPDVVIAVEAAHAAIRN